MHCADPSTKTGKALHSQCKQACAGETWVISTTKYGKRPARVLHTDYALGLPVQVQYMTPGGHKVIHRVAESAVIRKLNNYPTAP